jgi:hypothetical protein
MPGQADTAHRKRGSRRVSGGCPSAVADGFGGRRSELMSL